MISTPENPILIKKYSNRRLYDMDLKRYITLEELGERIKNGDAVKIVDSKTGEDLTQPVLIQLILETEKAPFQGLLTTELLHQVIRYQDKSLNDFYQRYLPNIMRSYVDWQQEAQDHFMHWAKLGWQANQMSRDMFMPGFNWFGETSPQSAPVPPEPSPVDEGLEVSDLKQKVADLEKRLAEKDAHPNGKH